MDAGDEGQALGRTITTERKSEREQVVTRTFSAPPHAVFEAWTRPELLKRWWAPRSFGVSLVSCEIDLRAGGAYRFVFGNAGSDQQMAFFGKYLEMEPPSRLVWTNEEGGADGPVTTLTLTEKGGETLLTMLDLYPSKEALDAVVDSGGAGGMCETFNQLDELLGALRAAAV